MARRPAIVVRRAEARDAEAIATTFEQPLAIAGTLQLPYPSRAAWVKRIADIPAGDYLLVAEIDGEVVGNCGLHPASMSLRRRHAGTVGMAVNDRWHRQGAGSALLAAALDLADNWIGYRRLELTAYTDNIAAVALYRRFGFEVEGTARAYALREGTLVDAFTMARLLPGARGAPAEARRRADAMASAGRKSEVRAAKAGRRTRTRAEGE